MEDDDSPDGEWQVPGAIQEHLGELTRSSKATFDRFRELLNTTSFESKARGTLEDGRRQGPIQSHRDPSLHL